MKCRTVIFVCLCFCGRAEGQIAIGEFLLSARQDPEVSTFFEQERYLQTKPYSLSPLQRLEFRTQNRELMPQQQEFGLRFTPSNPWEVKHNRNYFKSYQTALGLRREMALKEALVARYSAVINYIYYREVVALVRYSHKLVNDQLSILQRQSASNFFDADDFVDLQLDLMDRTVEIEEMEFNLLEQRHQVEKLYQRTIGDSLTWSWNQVAGVQRIARVVDSLENLSVASVVLAYQQRKIEMAMHEYKLEKANINAGFLQTEFDNRRQEQGRTPFNISLGITIPIVNPNKGDMTKRQLDIIEATYDLKEEEVEERDRDLATHERAERLFQRFAMAAEKLKAYETGSLSGTLSAMEGGDPRIIVKFNDNLVKLKLLLAKIGRDAMLAYIEYLMASDRIQQQPMVNYLSPSLQAIE